MGFGVRPVKFRLLPPVGVNDQAQLDHQQTFGEVARKRSGVDGGHGQHAPELQHHHVVVGVQRPVHQPIPSDCAAQCVAQPVRDGRDVVQAQPPRVEGLDSPPPQVPWGRALGSAGRVDDPDDHLRGLGFSCALLASEGEDGVRKVRDERRHQPRHQEAEAPLRGVEQPLEPGQPIPIPNGSREGLHCTRAAEQYGRGRLPLPAVRADDDASPVRRPKVDHDLVLVPGNPELRCSRLGVGRDALQDRHAVSQRGLRRNVPVVVIGVDPGELRTQARLAAKRERDVRPLLPHRIGTSVLAHEQVEPVLGELDELRCL